MIFDRASVAAILDGKRTVMRFPVDPTEPRYRRVRLRVRDTRQSQKLVQPFTPRVGDRWPVRSSAGARAACSVVVTAVEVVEHEPTEAIARAAGYRDLAAYQVAWVERHEPTWRTRERARRGALSEYDVIASDESDDGEPVRACHYRPVPDVALAARFGVRWAGELVWVVTFRLDREERARLLTRRVGSGSDYTSSLSMGLVTEPEAVGPAGMAKITARLDLERDQFAVLRAARRERQDVVERLREVIEEAESSGIDIGRQLASIDQRIESTRSKIQRTRRAA